MVPGLPVLIVLSLPPFILCSVEAAEMYLAESIRKAAAPIVGFILVWEGSSHKLRVLRASDIGAVRSVSEPWAEDVTGRVVKPI